MNENFNENNFNKKIPKKNDILSNSSKKINKNINKSNVNLNNNAITNTNTLISNKPVIYKNYSISKNKNFFKNIKFNPDQKKTLNRLKKENEEILKKIKKEQVECIVSNEYEKRENIRNNYLEKKNLSLIKKNIIKQKVQHKADIYNYRNELNKNLIEANKEKNKIKLLSNNNYIDNYNKIYCIKYIDLGVDNKRKNKKKLNNDNINQLLFK